MKEYFKLESEEEDEIVSDSTENLQVNITKDSSRNSIISSCSSKIDKTNYYYININHPEFNSQKETNEISTSKYTWYNLIPKILFEQFSKMANVYFLIIAFLQSIKEISYSGGVPVILFPLTFVICMNGIKDIFEDYKRKKSDEEENNKESEVYDASKCDFIKKKWKNIKLGEIVKVYQNDPFPADVLLINSADEHGICYIETKNLDGETTLKYRHSHSQLRNLYRNIFQFDKVNKIIQTSQPNEQIYDFEGKVFNMLNGEIIQNRVYDIIDRNSFLLRGCYLKQTEYIIGVTIYLGHNTKSMKNSPNTRSKTSKVEDIMNCQIIIIFLFQLSLSFVAALCNMLMYKNNIKYLEMIIYLNQFDSYSFLVFFTRTGTWLLIFTNLVPISLLVTMEMIKFIQGLFISWDVDLYDTNRYLGAKVQTSTLNEELGQVKFIFTDKTGTLTKNHMTFRKMMIGNKLYGEKDNSIEPDIISKKVTNGLSLKDKYGQITNTNFIDYNLKLEKNKNKEEVSRFLECISLCHSLIPDVKLYQEQNQLLYQASSPDEMSLVSFTRQLGFIFKERSIDNIVTLEINGVITQYKILCDLEYTSERKRMSVIAKCPDGKIRLYIKGADTILSKLLLSSNKDLLKYNEEALMSFSKEGLRTLMIAYKEIDQIAFNHFNESYRKIISDRNDKEQQLALLYNSIECQLSLLGVTAIEDQLQDNVDETLDFFIKTGIKIWMLTGDKMDTAKSVAFSCKLITQEFNIVEIPEKASLKTIRSIINDAKSHMKNTLLTRQYALIISSSELELVLRKDNMELRNKFYTLVLGCHCVVCSRVTPQQKAELVCVIKEYQKGTVLAIGDGANDVKMISKADIGIGINGLEGSQAARASDYSITTFSHLKKLLFVHGREAYRKNTFVICYNFYKNALFVMPQFWTGIVNFFSGQTLYDKWIYQFFNPIFACLPIIWLGIFDKEQSNSQLLFDTKYYLQGMTNKLFHSIRFWKWISYGIIEGLLIFIFSFFTLATPGSNGKMQDMWSIGTMAYSLIVLLSNFQVMLYTNSHTWISMLLILGSIVSYYIVVIIMSPFYLFSNFNNVQMVFLDLRFYMETMCLCVLILFVDTAISKICFYCGCVKEGSKLTHLNKSNDLSQDYIPLIEANELDSQNKINENKNPKTIIKRVRD